MSASAGPGDTANQVAPLPRNAATATEAASARQDGRDEKRAGAGVGRKPMADSIRRARPGGAPSRGSCCAMTRRSASTRSRSARSEEHTSELQSRPHLVCRLLLEKKKKKTIYTFSLRKKK